MHWQHQKRAAALAACLLAAAPMARAGADDDALIQQLKQLASTGQNAQTAAQVSQYIDQNQDAISAILKGYVNYLKQAQAMAADYGTEPQAAAADGQTAGVNVQAAGEPAHADATALQPSTGLQITDVQASGGLRTAHLAGYPALPDVDPVSSVTQPTAAQLEYAAKVQEEMQARKKELMESYK